MRVFLFLLLLAFACEREPAPEQTQIERDKAALIAYLEDTTGVGFRDGPFYLPSPYASAGEKLYLDRTIVTHEWLAGQRYDSFTWFLHTDHIPTAVRDNPIFGDFDVQYSFSVFWPIGGKPLVWYQPSWDVKLRWSKTYHEGVQGNVRFCVFTSHHMLRNILRGYDVGQWSKTNVITEKLDAKGQ